MAEDRHLTRPAKQRMGQNKGECQTCGKPTFNDKGIWKHMVPDPRIIADAEAVEWALR